MFVNLILQLKNWYFCNFTFSPIKLIFFELKVIIANLRYFSSQTIYFFQVMKSSMVEKFVLLK